HLAELRLVVPGVDLRGCAGREEPDGAPRARAEVGQRRQASGSRGEKLRLPEHREERDGADPATGAGQGLAPVQRPIRGAGAARGAVHRAHLLRASSRLKNWLATMVHAASSGAGTDGVGGESPRVTSARAAFASRAKWSRRSRTTGSRAFRSGVSRERARTRRAIVSRRLPSSAPLSRIATSARRRE